MKTRGPEQLLLLLLVACGPVEASLPMYLTATVKDGRTNVDPQTELGFAFFMSTPTPAASSSVAAGSSLLTWPELEALPSRVATDGGTRVVIAPTDPLSNRWYALHLNKVPAGVEEFGWPRFTKSTDGSLSSLFHVGTLPTLLAVEFYAEKGSFGLNFSEPLEFGGDASTLVTLDQNGTHFICQVHVPQNQIPGMAYPDTRWMGTCGPGIVANDAMTMTVVQGGFSDVRGLPLVAAFRPSELPWCGSGCGLVAVFANRGPQ